MYLVLCFSDSASSRGGAVGGKRGDTLFPILAWVPTETEHADSSGST